ncbi:IS21-like element helper ATPase IstB [Oxalicibacterium solurbis]|uniref:ATPase AAA n=1 Tax=Oxalicibacterium solurbis TaxID=69280 RepID=A0A8J3AYQ8_9BURK|nr:IS21-like element helper ATPase IstB [Oxalicibacterium solurbis]GGI55640.1 ATPase AAA [Oxalicibacterium solurbis]
MINNTIQQLETLKLFGMAEELSRQINNPNMQDLPFEHRVRSMVDHETTLRESKRLQLLLKKARLPINASIDDIDYRSPRGLDKSSMLTLSTLDWVRLRHNLVITGPTGTGKTWIACALANYACRLGLSSYFVRVPVLMESLLSARASGLFSTRLEQLKKFDLLILDDWGIETFSKRAQNDLLELVDSRLSAKSMIITSQFPMSHWHDALDNKTVADAIMDRIAHSSYSMQLSGESLRKIKGVVTKKTGKAALSEKQTR